MEESGFRKFLRLFTIFFIVLAIPVSLYLVGRATGFFGRASGVPADLLIDAGASFSDSNFVWQNLAQGGEEKGRMLASVVDKTKALRPNYIRIDHIYDLFDVIGKSGSQITFNWSGLDATVNDILATGARPFLSLSYMPPAISSTGNTTDNPSNWSDWELVVQRTIEHYSGRAGMNLQGVYFEVWNEPDLFGGFKTYGSKNYFDLYAHSVAGANRASNVNPFRIGGPATTALYETWASGFAKFVLQNNLRLDFYSWHRYSKNIDNFENNADNARRWLLEAGLPANLELVISELGPNSDVDKVYDTGFAAIHTIASSAVLEDKIQKVFNFEIKDGVGPSQYWGRWGIFTNDKFGAPIAKPRYSAFTFLNQMIGSRVNVAGQGSWVKAFAKTDGKTIRTLVVNYDPDGKHTEAVPMTYNNLPALNFKYRRINYGGGVARDIPVATDSANWATLELMNPNSAAIFEITPQ